MATLCLNIITEAHNGEFLLWMVTQIPNLENLQNILPKLKHHPKKTKLTLPMLDVEQQIE